MGTRRFRPVTPSKRFQVAPDFSEVTADRPERSLTVPLKRTGGRNNTGRMTQRRMGGGHKRSYRIIDFRRNKVDVSANVATIEYDPNRTARIALLHYADGEKRYILAPSASTWATRWWPPTRRTSSRATPCGSPRFRSVPSSTMWS